jgi:hypothetical protein
MFDNFLPKALFISLTIHTIFLCGSFLMQMPQVKNQKLKDKGVEVSYKPVKQKAPDVKERPIKPAQKLDLKSTMMDASGSLPIKLGKESQPLGKNFSMYERKPEQIRSSQMSHKVLITPIRSEKANSPAYTTYEEMLRNRIRDRVIDNFDNQEAGSVYLTFIIESSGQLKASQVLENRSQASQHLKDISLTSLQEAQFPPFIEGMTLPEYTFNIEIQYQIRD